MRMETTSKSKRLNSQVLWFTGWCSICREIKQFHDGSGPREGNTWVILSLRTSPIPSASKQAQNEAVKQAY